MKRLMWVLPWLAWSASLAGQTMNALTAQEQTQGWQLLFDGRTLAGWHASTSQPPAQPAPGQVGSAPSACLTAGAHWEVVDGSLTPCGAPLGYLISDRSYKDFVLSIEFKCAADANSGVFVRSPRETGGYEVQIWRQQPAGYNTGAIVGTAKTAREFRFTPDQWNRFEITADGDHLVVVLNGETTLDIHDATFPEGNLRLQYQQFPIAFRNIKLRPLR